MVKMSGVVVLLMKFIKLKCWLLLVLGGLISGCQFVPDIGLSEDKTAETVSGKTPELTVNPYQLHRGSVSSEAKQYFDQALKALANGDWQQAEFSLLWLTQHHPEFSGPWLNLAMLYVELEQIDKATPAFKQAIAVNGDNVEAYNQYAIFLRSQGDFSEAEKTYKQALAVWPDFPHGHLNLAILYDLYLGELDLALQHYQAYQLLIEQPDRQVAGWIIEAQRRLKNLAASENGGDK